MEDIKYRVMLGQDGDDYIYQGNLSWDKAFEIFLKIQPSLLPGVYSRIEEDD